MHPDILQQDILMICANQLDIENCARLLDSFRLDFSNGKDFKKMLYALEKYTPEQRLFLSFTVGTQFMLQDITDNFMMLNKISNPCCNPQTCTNEMCNYPDCKQGIFLKPATKC